MKNIYTDITKILTRNSLLYFVIGERGVGKSYSAKSYVANRFIKKTKQFVYLRRYKTELKAAMMKNSTPIFFDQIKNDPKFINHKLTNKSDTMYIDNKLAGFAISLSTANILKSSTFENVDTIIFDEFIIDNGLYHYLQNEIIQFLELIETIARLRDIKVILLGNAISITNVYFDYFNIGLPYKSTLKFFKEGLITLYYIENKEYRETKKATKYGQLIKDTDYGKYAIDNIFLRDSKAFIGKKSRYAKFFFTLIYKNQIFGIWCDYKNGCMFVSYDYDNNCPMSYTINNEDHNESTILISYSSSPYLKSILNYYKAGRLFFENQKIKNSLLKYFSKHIR